MGVCRNIPVIPEKLLAEFLKYCRNPSGKGRDDKGSRKSHNHVMNFFKLAGMEGVSMINNPKCLLNVEDLIKNKVFGEPNTAKNYIRSVIEFLNFLVFEHPEAGFTNFDLEKFTHKKQNWFVYINKTGGVSEQKRLQRDVDNMLTPADWQEYLNSEHVREVERYFSGETLLEHPYVTRRTFCIIRNHLITLLVLRNVCRSGAISECTLQAYHERAAVNLNGEVLKRMLVRINRGSLNPETWGREIPNSRKVPC